MDVNIFVNEYKMCKNDDSKKRFLDKHIKDIYIPYLEKVTICRKLTNVTSYKTIGEHKEFYIDSTNKYLLYTMTLINIYTDIDVDFSENAKSKVNEIYDVLCKSGVIPLVISNINPIEYEEFNLIMNMCMEDLFENERNMISYVEGLIETLKNTVSESVSSVAELVNNNPDISENINEIKNNILNYKEI